MSKASKRPDLIDAVEDFHPDGVAELDLYQKREKIYTRATKGFFQRLRVFTGWPLLLGYFILPWINWDGRQSVLFDLPERQFHILNFTFWPQDFYLLAGVLIIAAYALFTVTSWLGRVWCGYTCPQTVWTAIYMWAEQFCEGSRNQRMKRDAKPMHREKFLRKLAKHTMWVGFALLTAITFVGYFSPIREMVFVMDLGMWEVLWITFFTSATYINAGYMREQVCIYMCPYARFQSAMFTPDTLIVSYDEKRGEPRGARKKSDNLEEKSLGSCTDCQICVQVCPTGIDIRDGLQLECINCALCVDACDDVMDQMGYERGLIKYTTEHELDGKPRELFHPRFVGYATVLIVMVAIFVTAIFNRVPLEMDVIRDRDRLFNESSNGMIENSYTIKIMNKSQQAHDYQVRVEGLEGVVIKGRTQARLEAGEVTELPLRLQVKREDLNKSNYTIMYHVDALDSERLTAEAESRFIGPTPRR